MASSPPAAVTGRNSEDPSKNDSVSKLLNPSSPFPHLTEEEVLVNSAMPQPLFRNRASFETNPRRKTRFEEGKWRDDVGLRDWSLKILLEVVLKEGRKVAATESGIWVIIREAVKGIIKEEEEEEEKDWNQDYGFHKWWVFFYSRGWEEASCAATASWTMSHRVDCGSFS